MPTVYIPQAWRDLTGGVEHIELAGGNLRQIIAALEGKFPGLAARAILGDSLASGVAASIDGSMTGRLLTGVLPDSEIHFLPALGGG